MKSAKLLLEEIGVAVICILVVTLYSLGVLCEWSWTAFLTPILAALLVGGFLRFRTYWYLKGLNSEYKQYDLQGKPLPDKRSRVKFSPRNLLRIRPTLFVNQESETKGNWESYITVSGLNPLLSSGFYKYTTSGNAGGGRKDDWGVHELHINPEDGMIHVRAVSKSRPGENEYILKKIGSA